MSQQQTKSRKIGEVVNRMEELYPRQMSGSTWRVLSTRNGSLTAHDVDVYDLTCTCGDMEFNTEDPQVCDHIAVALFEAPKRVSIEDHLLSDLLDLYEAEQSALDRSTETTEARTTEEVLEDTQPEPETSQETTTDTADPDLTQMADDVEDWLSTAVTGMEHIQIYIGGHGGASGVVIEPDNGDMTDGQYEGFKGVVNALDGSEVHVGFTDDPCGNCGEKDGEFYYHVPVSSWSEVPGA